jgi:hypothetical protein
MVEMEALVVIAVMLGRFTMVAPLSPSILVLPETQLATVVMAEPVEMVPEGMQMEETLVKAERQDGVGPSAIRASLFWLTAFWLVIR